MYREWSTVCLEQPVVVKTWYRKGYFFRLKEELWIGNRLLDRNKIWTGNSDWFICERLAAPVSIAESVHHLEVSIYHHNYKNYHCNISLDGEIIGGDIDVKIPRTDLGTWPEIHRRGFRHFMFEYMHSNILKIVFRVAAVTIFFFSLGIFGNFVHGNPLPIDWEFARSVLYKIAPMGIFWLFAEVSFGYFPWQMWEKLYAQTLAHQRKLDLPPVRLEIDKHEVY
jgi:hypothetical protein